MTRSMYNHLRQFLAIFLCITMLVQILSQRAKMRTDLDIGAEKSETTTVSGFFRAIF